MLCYAMLCYAMPCYAMLFHPMLCGGELHSLESGHCEQSFIVMTKLLDQEFLAT